MYVCMYIYMYMYIYIYIYICAGTLVTLHLYDFMTSGEGQVPGGLRGLGRHTDKDALRNYDIACHS